VAPRFPVGVPHLHVEPSLRGSLNIGRRVEQSAYKYAGSSASLRSAGNLLYESDVTMRADHPLVEAGINATQLGAWLPSQAFGSRRRYTPEKRLMLAVLSDALHCLERPLFENDHQARLRFEETRRWFLADDWARSFSFSHICEVLDLDPRAVRESLPSLRERVCVSARRACREEGARVSRAQHPLSLARVFTRHPNRTAASQQAFDPPEGLESARKDRPWRGCVKKAVEATGKDKKLNREGKADRAVGTPKRKVEKVLAIGSTKR